MELFPDLPDDLSGLTADELTALLTETVEVCDQIAAGEADLEGADPVDVMTRGVEIAERLRAEEARRVEKAKADAEKIEQLRSRLHPAEAEAETPETPSEDDGEDGDDGEETPAEPETPDAPEADAEADDAPEADVQPIAAAARKTPPARRSSRSTPQPDPKRLVSITAAADIPGMPMGSELGSLREIGTAMTARFKGIGRSNVRDEKVPVATIHADYPEDRMFGRGDDRGNMGKVYRIRDQIRRQDAQAILAGGGLCAPVEPYYGLKQIATTSRPVRDGMARFGAERGGIRFAPPPSIDDFDAAITIVSAADDASGGSAAIKATLEVECLPFEEVDVGIISHQLTFHNLTARSWPEQVDNAVANTMAAHSRLAETALLDAVASGSTAVTEAAINGFSVDWPEAVLRAATAYRSRHRSADDYTLRLLAPQWAEDAYYSDLWATQFYRQSDSQNTLDMKFAEAGVVVSYYLDTPTGGSQVFPVQAVGALGAYPSECIWYLFDEGGWLFLDGGALELGLVRDSVLNALNEYTMFGETFEGAAFIGIESLQVTQDVCTTGNTGGPTSNVC